MCRKYEAEEKKQLKASVHMAGCVPLLNPNIPPAAVSAHQSTGLLLPVPAPAFVGHFFTEEISVNHSFFITSISVNVLQCIITVSLLIILVYLLAV